MVNVGPLEIVLVAIIALIVLGPARLPEVARSVGRGMREFRSALSSAGQDDDHGLEPLDDEEDEEDEEPPPLPTEPPGAEAEDDAAEEDAAEEDAGEDLPEGR